MDKITLTKAAYMRYHQAQDWCWERLVAESQRPELIERWAVVFNDGSCSYGFESRKSAEDYMGNNSLVARIVHLREVGV